MIKFLTVTFITLLSFVLLGCNGSAKQDEVSWTNYINNTEEDIEYADNEQETDYNNALNYAVEVEIPAGQSLREAGKEVYAYLLDWEERYNFGGVKLCAEMSADREGKPYSSFYRNTTINFRPPEELHLKRIETKESPFCIVSEIVNGDISADVGTIATQYSGYFQFQNFLLPITISNLRDYPVGVHIPCGLMFEVQTPGVQNIAVSQTIKIMVEPNSTETIQVQALCAAHKRKDPTYHSAKFTPFILDAPTHAFISQNNLWNFMVSEPQKNRKWQPFTKTIRVSDGTRLYIEEKNNGIGPYSSFLNSPKKYSMRQALNITGFPVGFQDCAAQHDIDYGTLGVTQKDADDRLKECAESVFNGTVGDFCHAQGIGLEQLCNAIGKYVYDVSEYDSFASFVLAAMAGGGESHRIGQKWAKETTENLEKYKDEIEQALGIAIDANRYYVVLKK